MHWKSLHRERAAELSFEISNDGSIAIFDSRYPAEADRYSLSGLTAEFLLRCGPRPTRLRGVAEAVGHEPANAKGRNMPLEQPSKAAVVLNNGPAR